MAFVIGLTGGIGCGKSTVSRLFADLGVMIVDTDVIAKKFTEVNGLAVNTIREAFGSSFINSVGAVDRVKMLDLIFSDNNARARLEKILHPLILREVTIQIEQITEAYIIIVVPLLFETHDYDNSIERILVVDCNESLQLSRTMTRSRLSEEKVKAIMATQVTRQRRLLLADDVIVNDHDIDSLKKQVHALHKKYLAFAKRK
ncbi:dephospho-CoA kinase [Nitrosomonas sp. PY1]|uniref:dephospho-CoA kinase n=1 Tax=Nitrosomonas sp. PY1 TaxID=1803906 RepID=UPI001FC871B3|nr:dephospho-CoA kinase [Nitrosomonas sp. PY1]GKS70426.1 dephospho-CoA kinase [Nitrosomonas sp. PY1]